MFAILQLAAFFVHAAREQILDLCGLVLHHASLYHFINYFYLNMKTVHYLCALITVEKALATDYDQQI